MTVLTIGTSPGVCEQVSKEHFCSAVVITFALHAKGPCFITGQTTLNFFYKVGLEDFTGLFQPKGFYDSGYTEQRFICCHHVDKNYFIRLEFCLGMVDLYIYSFSFIGNVSG